MGAMINNGLSGLLAARRALQVTGNNVANATTDGYVRQRVEFAERPANVAGGGLSIGNGVGINEDNIMLSLLGPHYFNAKRRQMVITIDELFLFASKSTGAIPGFIKNGMGIGKRPEDFEKRPPAFTMIGASDRALIARGGSGGIAIWSRLSKDIRPAAYGPMTS